MNTNQHNINFANQMDCGDGVPALQFERNGDERTVGRIEKPTIEQGEAKITAKTFALGATVLGQIIVAIAMLIGGNPAVGAIAALAICGCGLALVAADANRED